MIQTDELHGYIQSPLSGFISASAPYLTITALGQDFTPVTAMFMLVLMGVVKSRMLAMRSAVHFSFEFSPVFSLAEYWFSPGPGNAVGKIYR